jgi:O-acetyl-ADP-ribose deacetylase
MPFEIVRNDIRNMQVDAIVNSANPQPTIGGSVDLLIHEAAGPELIQERKLIGTIHVGESKITPAFQLKAKYVIHTVGPLWIDGKHDEFELLEKCYLESLKLADLNHCASIAFPLISTGTFGFPKDKALRVATDAIQSFLNDHDMMVYLVVYDESSFKLSKKLVDHIRAYIDTNYIEEHELVFESFNRHDAIDSSEDVYRNVPSHIKRQEKTSIQKVRDWKGLEDEIGETFSVALLRLIDERGKTDVEIYRQANIDRKLFSKIRSNKDYQPSKMTAIALSVALHLNLDETKDLIGRAGFALTKSNLSDIIFMYFIEHKIYDIYEINKVLFIYNLKEIGSI